MPRFPRVFVKNVPYHIYNRGHRRKPIFRDDEDRELFLKLFEESGKRHGLRYLGYCLMNNHFHLNAIPEEAGSIPLVMATVKRKFTLAINTRNGWTGSLWESRFHAYPMDRLRFFPNLRYIERNPVRAGIVENAEDYRWSSARAHVFSRVDEHLTLEVIENINNNRDWRLFLKVEETAEFIVLIRKHEQTGRPFGNDRFLRRLERLSGRSLIIKPPGRKKK